VASPSLADTGQNDVFRGSLYMALAMLSFIANDAIIKHVGQTMPTGQLLVVRGVMVMIIIGAVCSVQGVLGNYTLIVSKPVMLRAASDLITTILFINALLNLPLANANTVLLAAPFVVIVLATLFLGERVGWRRLSAVSVGFVGVLMIVRPGAADFNIYTLFAVGALFSVSLRDIFTRRIPAHVPSMIIALANAIVVTIGGLAWAAFGGWSALTFNQLFMLAASAVLLAAAYSFMVLTIRACDVSSTAPMRYTVAIWSILFGYLFFGELPDGTAFAGIALIVVSGIYALTREARLRKRGRNITHISKKYRW
jgi:drug/metabolite transporter (DMT)-like permease